MKLIKRTLRASTSNMLLVSLLLIATLLTSTAALSKGHVYKLSVNETLVNKVEKTQVLTRNDAKNIMATGPQLVVMWSLECPACFDELDTLAQLLKARPNLAVTLISTDDDPSRITEIEEVYQQPAFNNIPRWIYAANQGQKLRYIIDKSWQGELPRSYYIDAAGKQYGHSGLLSQSELTKIAAVISK